MRFLLSLLLCWSASAATQVVKYIAESGGDYTSLYDWEFGRQTNCVTADSIEIAEITGAWTAVDPDGAVTLDSWTTDATHYIEIRTDATARHPGYWSATDYILTAAVDTLTIKEDYVRVYGLQLELTGTGTSKGSIYAAVLGTSAIDIAYCILKHTGSGTSCAGIWINDADCTFRGWNNIAYGYTGRCYYGNAGTAVTWYNCTAFSGGEGFRRGTATMNMYNCIAQDHTVDAIVGTIGGNKNVCDTETPPGTNPITGEVAFVSETGGSENLHLDAADTVAKDATTDQSSGLFSDDIDGVARTGSWDVGADEYVAAGTSPKQVIVISIQ